MKKTATLLVVCAALATLDARAPLRPNQASAQVAIGPSRPDPDPLFLNHWASSLAWRWHRLIYINDRQYLLPHWQRRGPDRDQDAHRFEAGWAAIERAMKADVVRAMKTAAGHRSGAAFAWTLDDKVIGAMVVYGAKAADGFAAETEYHAFIPDASTALRAAQMGDEQLRMQRMPTPWRAARLDGSEAEAFAAHNPRTFVADETARDVKAAPDEGRFLFHVSSKLAGQADIEHYVEIHLSADGGDPTLSWYVETTQFESMATDLKHAERDWRRADQWQVAPIDDGLLTPISEVTAHELTPTR